MFEKGIIVTDAIAQNTQTVSLTIRNIPVCPIVYPNDLEQIKRKEEAFLAYAWADYLNSEDHDPLLLPILPMVKGAYKSLQATKQYLKRERIANIESFNVLGASKRGWTALSMATTNCTTCEVKINSVGGLVPLMPDLRKEIHEQLEAYGGFSFAFIDYLN